MIKNISILCSESEFTPEQLQKLSFTGKVSFVDSKSGSSLKDLIKLSKEADILAFSPDKFGKSASRVLSEILEASPKVKGLALNSTNSDCVDLEYCQERGIKVTFVLDSAIHAVAEQTIMLLLGCARNIFINGWQAQKRIYQEELGFELAGKTLGIIGAGAVSEELIKLAKPFGLRIFFWDETLTRIEGAHRKSLNEVLVNSDLLTINLPETEANKKFLNKEKIDRIKQGTMVINLSGRTLVDEKSMVEALKERRINQYVFETERFISSPLQNIEYALAFKPMSRKTQESINRSKASWVTNIANLAGISTS